MIGCVFSASAVVSDIILPVGCRVGRPTHGTGGGIRVDGPATIFMCSLRRARDLPYGWNLPIDLGPVLAGPVPGLWEVYTFSCGKTSTGIHEDKRTPVLTIWNVLVEGPLWFPPQLLSGTVDSR